MKPIAILLLAWWFVMHSTAGGSASQPLVVGPFQDKSVCEQERLYWSQRGFVTSIQCFQG